MESSNGSKFFGKATDLLSGPADVAHPRKWSPPSPEILELPVEQRPEWLHDETLPFLDLFDRRVKSMPDQVALSWFEENGKLSQTFTYSEFDAKSRAIAATLLDAWSVKNGDPVVLVYPPGLEFLVAFVACLRAGVIAVPVYPPNPNDLSHDLPKMQRVVADSGATLVLTTTSYLSVVRLSMLRFIRWPGKVWQTTDNVKSTPTLLARVFDPPKSPVAFLQYTSGSTGDPKGVMVGSTNIAHNMMFVRRTLRLHQSSRFFSWLPQYHDLGLIVAYLSTLSAGSAGFYMSPVAFIKRPALWVQLMSKHRITHTAAPNFALELCSRKFDPKRDAAEGLDLSPLESLLNAAEPVRAESIKKWNKTFEPYGWHPSSMCPCYGLAEHVVGVVGWGTKVVEVGEGSLRHTLHSSGSLKTFPVDGRVVTVNPDTLTICEEGEEGEIWVRSQHVTHGYWNKPDLTEETFKGKLAPNTSGADDGLYLRTGDLAFILEDQVFVTGRIKDLIIIRGKNYYPQDIEKTVEDASEHVRAGCAAAFSVQAPPGTITSAEEAVAIVAEVRSAGLTAAELEKATYSIRKAVVTAHGVVPATVALIPPRSIPKTTSGKIRRRETCSKLTQGALKILNKKFSTTDKAALEENKALTNGDEPDTTSPEKENQAPVKEIVWESSVLPVQPEPIVAGQVAPAPVTTSPEAPAPAAAAKPVPATSQVAPSPVTTSPGNAAPPAAEPVPTEQVTPGQASASPGCPAPTKVYISPEIPDPQKSLEASAGFEEGEKEWIEGVARWEGMSIEEATVAILGVQDQELSAEESLISLGLTSMTGMDIIDLVENRTEVGLEPEQLQLLTIGDLRALDQGGDLTTIVKEREALQGKVEDGDVAHGPTTLLMDDMPEAPAAVAK